MDFRKTFNDKIILVTGGAGAIGSNLSRALADAGAAKVIILDDLSASYSWNIPNLPNVLFIKGSITNDVDLKRVFHEKPDYISIMGYLIIIFLPTITVYSKASR